MARKTEQTVLVTGATGHQGGAALRHLREKGFSVRALTRNPDKAEARSLVGKGTEVVRGDLDDPASLTRAMEGVNGVFSVQTHGEGGTEAEIRQGRHVVDAARRAGVGHFVYSSVAAADKNTGIPFFESKFLLEQYLQSSGLHHTIFRPVYFMENWMAMRGAIEQGVLSLPLKAETRLQMIAVDDIGAFVAMAFTHPRHWEGRIVELAGDEVSMADAAAAFGRMVGHDVRYEQMGWEQFEQRMGRDMTFMWRFFESEGLHIDIPALRQELTGMLTFEHWLRARWSRRLTA